MASCLEDAANEGTLPYGWRAWIIWTDLQRRPRRSSKTSKSRINAQLLAVSELLRAAGLWDTSTGQIPGKGSIHMRSGTTALRRFNSKRAVTFTGIVSLLGLSAFPAACTQEGADSSTTTGGSVAIPSTGGTSGGTSASTGGQVTASGGNGAVTASGGTGAGAGTAAGGVGASTGGVSASGGAAGGTPPIATGGTTTTTGGTTSTGGAAGGGAGGGGAARAALRAPTSASTSAPTAPSSQEVATARRCAARRPSKSIRSRT
jgi:hypothetical protein